MSLLDTIAAEPRALNYERRPSLGVDLHVQVRQVRLPNGRKVFASLLQQHGLRAKCFVDSPGRPTTAAVVTGTSLQDATVLEWVGTTGIVTLRLHRAAVHATLHVEVLCGSLVLASAELALDSISKEENFPSTWIPLSPDGHLELSFTTAPLVANNEDTSTVLKEDATTTESDDDKRDENGAPSPEKCAREEGDDVNNDETIIDEAPTFSFYHREPIHDQLPPKIDVETWHLFKFGIASDPPPLVSHHSGISTSALERPTPYIAGPDTKKKVVLYDPAMMHVPTLADDRRRLLPGSLPPRKNRGDASSVHRRPRIVSFYNVSDLQAKSTSMHAIPPPIIIDDDKPSPVPRALQRIDVGRSVVVGSTVVGQKQVSLHSGIVRFVGPTRFADGVWIGIELRDSLGNHNGSVSGINYFRCPARRGIFVRANKPDDSLELPLP